MTDRDEKDLDLAEEDVVAEGIPSPATEPQVDEENSTEELDPSQLSAEELAGIIERADERDRFLSQLQRTQADFENFRKRAARDAASAELRGVIKLASELLPAVDNLQSAVQMISAEQSADPDAFKRGLELVLGELGAALKRVGVTEFDPAGEQFDPQLHEAMTRVSSEEHESNSVVEVFQRGYRVDQQVIRPARVAVAE